MERPSAQTEGRPWDIRAQRGWCTGMLSALNKRDPREGSGHKLGAWWTQDGLLEQGSSGAEVGKLEDSEQSNVMGATGHQLWLIVRMESSTIGAAIAAPLLSVPGHQGAKGSDVPGNGQTFWKVSQEMMHFSCSQDTCVHPHPPRPQSEHGLCTVSSTPRWKTDPCHGQCEIPQILANTLNIGTLLTWGGIP